MMSNKVGVLFQVVFPVISVLSGCNPNSSNVSSNYEIEPEKKIAVECTLTTKDDAGSIFALLEFKNTTGKDGLVHKRILLSDSEFGAFEVARDGEEVAYMGPFVDKGWSAKDDWHLLKAGETYETTIRISDYYDFSSPGEYQVTYRRAYSPRGKLTILQSNTVKFVVRK